MWKIQSSKGSEIWVSKITKIRKYLPNGRCAFAKCQFVFLTLEVLGSDFMKLSFFSMLWCHIGGRAIHKWHSLFLTIFRPFLSHRLLFSHNINMACHALLEFTLSADFIYEWPIGSNIPSRLWLRKVNCVYEIWLKIMCLHILFY